jgi:NADPH2:quinone reductase
MVTFGNASGPVPPLDVGILAGKGSLKVTRPTLTTYVLNRQLLESGAADLFQRVISGQIKIEITDRYPLEKAGQAQKDMADRKTTGSIILVP